MRFDYNKRYLKLNCSAAGAADKNQVKDFAPTIRKLRLSYCWLLVSQILSLANLNDYKTRGNALVIQQVQAE
jgi:hypothetical protein